MKGSNKRPVTTRSIVIAALLLALGNVFADEVLEEESTFDIADQPLDQALLEFSRQADVQIIMAAETARGLDAEAIHGTQRNRDALEQLLADRGLEYSEHSNRTIAVHRTTAVAAEGGDSDSGNRAAAGATPMVLADIQTGAKPTQVSQPNERETERQKLPIEEIVVTGTNIRGIAPESSPTRTFTREDIQITAAWTAQDFIQTLPSNFGGGANANIPLGLPNDISGGANSGSFGSFGSSVNLRGLGSGSSLVLLNGHRVAPASFNGDFVDISMVPASAIERVEILTDGASSIYGSDAVDGVVNFILRDDYEGLETSLRYGTGTQHGTPDQYRASVTGGQNWGSGHALLVYEFFNQEQLSVEDRYFVPHEFLPNYLLPSQKRHSVLVSASQDVTPDLKLFADLTFSTRKARQLRTLFDDGRTSQFDASSDNVNIAAGGAWNIFSDWYFDFSGTYSKVDTRNQTSILLDNLQVTDSSMWTADAKLSGSLFHFPGGDVKLAFGGHYRTESFLAVDVERTRDTVQREATRDVYALFGEAFIPIIGPDNTLPGIERGGVTFFL